MIDARAVAVQEVRALVTTQGRMHGPQSITKLSWHRLESATARSGGAVDSVKELLPRSTSETGRMRFSWTCSTLMGAERERG
ncbi:hypothetical protein C0Q70_11451 [Pomacea canaliculata]|uniref:Uncharacterized protein n=1 Tax=Pomacea canaliculata TaxID=400727 RepID=A0A2T7P632_POMCA|nr:hypothetical protein C0Q70_11451 [Pomacea canaliculata]